MVRQLRKFAQSAQDDLRDELGPEFADLKLTDLDPRVAIRKHILEAMEEDDLDRGHRQPRPRRGHRRTCLGPDERPPYDAEAT